MSQESTYQEELFIQHAVLVQESLIGAFREMELHGVDEINQGCIMESRLQDKLRMTWKAFVLDSSAFTFSSGHIFENDGSSFVSPQNDIILHRDSLAQRHIERDSVAATCECKLTLKQKITLEKADVQIGSNYASSVQTHERYRPISILIAFQLYHLTNQSSPHLPTIKSSWISSLRHTQHFFVFYNPVKKYKTTGPFGIFAARCNTPLGEMLCSSSTLDALPKLDDSWLFASISQNSAADAHFIYVALFLSLFLAARRLDPSLSLSFDLKEFIVERFPNMIHLEHISTAQKSDL